MYMTLLHEMFYSAKLSYILTSLFMNILRIKKSSHRTSGFAKSINLSSTRKELIHPQLGLERFLLFDDGFQIIPHIRNASIKNGLEYMSIRSIGTPLLYTDILTATTSEAA